jgi:phosphotransacetylase
MGVVMKITCLKDLADEAIAMREKTVVAVVEAQDEHTIGSVLKAEADGIMRPILIGDAGKVMELLDKSGADPSGFEIVPSGNAEDSLKRTMELIRSGRAGAMMKGNVDTALFMKAVVSRENGLLSGGRLSLAALFETPGYHKLFAISDVVINTYPDFDCKRAIIENAVSMLGSIGIKQPKVALLAAVEKVNTDMPETVDADALKKLNQSGGIANCVIEGPISFDLATSAEAARRKGYDSPVAGDADLLIVPDIAAGNLLAKCLTGMAGARTAGTVLGAKVPIVLTSRSADASDRYFSIALAACAGRPGAQDRG